MKIRKAGIYRDIDHKDWGYYQAKGFEKVVDGEEPVVAEDIAKEEPTVEETTLEEPVVKPKKPKLKNK